MLVMVRFGLVWFDKTLTRIYLLQNFDIKLRAHVLPRILSKLRSQAGDTYDRLPLPDQCDADAVISFRYNRFYQHRIVRINYTTYDVRREQDLVNAHSAHCNVMVLCQSDNAISYRYARVISTFHVNAGYNGPGGPHYLERHRVDVLWVRWYDEVGESGTGWAHKRLGRLRFAPIEDSDAFGFIDPADVLRGCHIIPCFRRQKVHVTGRGRSRLARDDSDWKEYYINRSVLLHILAFGH